jgi:hypothetical protein
MKKSFGKYAIIDPVKHVFEKEPEWYWMIKPPTAKDELAVSRILATDRSRIEIDGSRTSMLPTTLEIAMREIAVTFGGTNIPTSETDPAPVLKDNATVEQVEDLLKEMPRGMVFELWTAVGNAIPGWGPAKPRPQQMEKSAGDTTDTPKN